MSRDRPDPAQAALALDLPETGPGAPAAPARGAAPPATGPSDATVRRLFAVSMNRCAFPGCAKRIIDPATRAIQAEVCHIHARDARGPRYDPDQPDVERHGFDNLLLLCADHHRFIDAKEALSRFTPAALQQLKAAHEKEARKRAVLRVRLTDDQLAVLQGVPRPERGVPQEFRQGIVTSKDAGAQDRIAVVGTTRVPAAAAARRGAVVENRGRPVDTDDLARGFRIGALFLANSVAFNNALLDAAGAGWSYVGIPQPIALRLPVAMVIDFGDVEPWTLLRLRLRVLSPAGEAAQDSVLDLEVPDNEDLVKRLSIAHPIEFTPSAFGVWSVELRSGGHLLGVLPFECRQTRAA